MLDFVENADESAAGIVSCIMRSLEKLLGLSMDQVSAFSADNTNVNYGIHNYVYTNLKKTQNDLLRGNCHAHVVHSTVKYALGSGECCTEGVQLLLMLGQTKGLPPDSCKVGLL